MQGSGWFVEIPAYLEVEVVQCRPLRGQANVPGQGCGLHLAKYRRSKGVVPTQLEESQEGDDGMCFYYAIARHFWPEANNEELYANICQKFVGVTETCKRLQGKGFSLQDVADFEKCSSSSLNLAINVVYRDENVSIIYPKTKKLFLRK